MGKYTVYIHRNITNGKVYIGLTCQKVEKRWFNGNGYKHSTYFYNAIKKHGWDGFLHEVVMENLTKEEACALETELIKQYNSASREFGYNATYGGEANVPTQATRIKMSANHADYSGKNNPNWGKEVSLETRNKLSQANKGKIPSELTIRRAIEHNTGKKDSPETLYKKRLARLGEKNPNWGKTHSLETRRKISEKRPDFSGANNPRARAVICINTGEVFKTTKEAAAWCGIIAYSHISKCCSGGKKHIGKHPVTRERLKWMYFSENV